MKRALARMRGNLEKQAKDWRDSQQVTIPVKSKVILIIYRHQKFELQEEDKL